LIKDLDGRHLSSKRNCSSRGKIAPLTTGAGLLKTRGLQPYPRFLILDRKHQIRRDSTSIPRIIRTQPTFSNRQWTRNPLRGGKPRLRRPHQFLHHKANAPLLAHPLCPPRVPVSRASIHPYYPQRAPQAQVQYEEVMEIVHRAIVFLSRLLRTKY
jgi:hypothetical protein